MYLATLAGGGTRIVPDGRRSAPEFDRQRIVGGRQDSPAAKGDRRGRARSINTIATTSIAGGSGPLPVLVARLNDADRTRYYIDPKTARSSAATARATWTTRWLYHGLHSLDFPWLYNHRPAWDIVVIALMLGGAALSVTSIVLAWRVVTRQST